MSKTLSAQFSVTELCAAFSLGRSGYYAHQHKMKRPRRQKDARLKEELAISFSSSRNTYGAPRRRVCLQRAGQRCGKNRVSRLLRELGLRPRQKRRFRPCTTPSRHRQPVAENWLSRVPHPDRPEQVWVADICQRPPALPFGLPAAGCLAPLGSDLWTAEGWLSLAGLLDLCTRGIVAWSVSESLESGFVLEAWQRACARRRPPRGLLAHSDRGGQDASAAFQEALRTSGACASMSRKGNCDDNAHQESFWATLKAECFAGEIPQSRAQAKAMLFDYLEGFYNTHRLHSALGYLSPKDFEENLPHQSHLN